MFLCWSERHLYQRWDEYRKASSLVVWFQRKRHSNALVSPVRTRASHTWNVLSFV